MPLPVETPPLEKKEVFLNPGDFYFGDAGTRIATLLGSCVAVTLWHPKRRIGGMCHYMLPSRPDSKRGQNLDGRYADGALALFMRELARTGTTPSEYVVKLMGGARMFAYVHGADYRDIGTLNIRHGKELLDRHGFRIRGEHLAGQGHRKVVFDLESGEVKLLHDTRTPKQIGSVVCPAKGAVMRRTV